MPTPPFLLVNRETFLKMSRYIPSAASGLADEVIRARDHDFLSSRELPGNHWTHSGPSCSGRKAFSSFADLLR